MKKISQHIINAILGMIIVGLGYGCRSQKAAVKEQDKPKQEEQKEEQQAEEESVRELPDLNHRVMVLYGVPPMDYK